jgi:hypothetical protein
LASAGAGSERLQDPALDREHGEPDHEREAEDVQEERVAEVEPPLPEVEAEHRLGEVVLEREDRGSGEEHHEAVEDEEVPEARKRVAPPDPRVRDDDLGRADRALEQVPDRRLRAPAAVLEAEARGSEEEDRDGDDDQAVPQNDLPGLEAGEGLARFLGAQQDGHQ